MICLAWEIVKQLEKTIKSAGQILYDVGVRIDVLGSINAGTELLCMYYISLSSEF